MVRVALVIAVIAVGVLAFKQRSDRVAASAPAATMPRVAPSEVPKEFRPLLAIHPDPAQLLGQRGALPGLGAIRRLTSSDEAAPAVRPFADVGTARQLKRVRADIRRGFAELNRLSRTGRASIAEVERTLARVYSAPVLAALGTDGRRAFAARYAGRTQAAQKVEVLDYEGIFVSGRRALAQVVYSLSLRAASGRFVARAPSTWTVTLARERGRWRFVRGIES
ncbi:MAG TPA: hypothetical protein VNS09_13040 [Solirubrobacter sp.]|nr:hypothetical protein [Solirubrobacter sp.]